MIFNILIINKFCKWKYVNESLIIISLGNVIFLLDSGEKWRDKG